MRRHRGRALSLVALAAAVAVLAGCSVAGSATRAGGVAVSPSSPGWAPPSPEPGSAWTWAASRRATLPADLREPRLPRCPVTARPGWVARENRRPGDASWRYPDDPTRTPTVEAYADAESVPCGGRVGIHLGGAGAPSVVVRVYRVGWYHGTGARLVWVSAPVDVPSTPPDAAQPGGPVPTPWPGVRVEVPVGATWAPGIYLAEPWLAGRPDTAAPFVVRGAPSARLLLVHSDMTWQAYSTGGGASLYGGPSRTPGLSGGLARQAERAARAHAVAFARPVVGTDQLGGYDLPVARFVDRLGLDVDHAMDVDVDATPSLLLRYAGVVWPGHTEYWSRRMYDAALVARTRGVNLAFLGGNVCYWQARVHRVRGRAVTLVSYKDAAIDPVAAAHPALATGLWRAPPLRRDQAALTGQTWSAAGLDGGLLVRRPPAWLVAGTAVRDGTFLDGAVGNEADGVVPGSLAAPPSLQVLALGAFEHHDVPPALVTAVYSTDPSGAAVFAAGPTTWACDLDNSCDTTVPGPTVAAIEGMTANLLRGFAVRAFGSRHPASPYTPVSVADVVTTLGPGRVGHHDMSSEAKEARS